MGRSEEGIEGEQLYERKEFEARDEFRKQNI